MSFSMEKVKEEVVPGLFAGGIAAAATMYLGGGSAYVNFPLIGNIPVPLALGGVAAAGHITGAIATDYVLPSLQGNTYFEGEDKIIPPLMAGGATALAMKLLISPNSDIQTSVIFGAGSSAAGIYAYDMIYN